MLRYWGCELQSRWILEHCKPRLWYGCNENHLSHPQNKKRVMCWKSRLQCNVLKLWPRKSEWHLMFWWLGSDPIWLVLLGGKDETPSHAGCGSTEYQSIMGGQPQMKAICKPREDTKPANTWKLSSLQLQKCEEHEILGQEPSVVLCDDRGNDKHQPWSLSGSCNTISKNAGRCLICQYLWQY